jgi:hypothetical protein
LRVNYNPNKKALNSNTDFKHHVVIPVYIPHFDGYFKDSFRILKLCLGSLLKTINNQTYVTIVNNGSCNEIIEYLNQKYENNEIHEIIHTSNIGKLNAIVKGVIGHNFEFVTIADADVLFLNDWQSSTYKVFNNFSKAGVVGIVPQFKLYSDLCYNILFDFFFSSKLAFTKVKNPEAMKNFYKSIGWDDSYNKDYLRYNLTLRGRGDVRAVVGSGHFIATYHKDVVKRFNLEYSNFKMGKELRKKFDWAALKAGRYRFTTEDSYAFHMGNVYEPYMNEVYLKLEPQNEDYNGANSLRVKQTYMSYVVKNHLFRKLLENNWFINRFIRFKGLPVALTKKKWHN